jgi:ABC-type polysaccharide/polyol phosphate export permease
MVGAKAAGWRVGWRAVILLCAANFAILTGAMLLAVWARLRLALGQPLGADYAAQPPLLYPLLALAAVVACGVALALPPDTRAGRWLAPWRQFRILALAAGLAVGLIWLLLPAVSGLQMAWFVAAALLLGGAVIVLPGRLRRSAYADMTISHNLRQLYANRDLLFIWLRYRVRSRYSQTVLGVLWIILLPLANALVLAFAFTQLLGRGSGLSVPFIAFLLSGQVLFGVFSHVVNNSKVLMLEMMEIIKQVYFPRELIVLLIVGEALVDFAFTLLAMLVINTALGVPLTPYFLLIPVPLLLMTVLALGVGFIISWLAILVRDLQPLIAVGMQLLFYVTVLFSSENAHPRYEFLMAVNPVSAIVEFFRDLTLYGRMPDPVRLYPPVVIAAVLVYFGYVFFKVNEDRLADYA